MDGYSVHDAATVLGIPEARVWELIARGVLAGAPEADGGMRVFLKGSQPPATRAQDADRTRDEDREARNGNGGGGAAAEVNPFRELLTEFRNLTERYGQALLALGEARGEVAALRSRVDMLEARIDLRLPPARPASTVAWEMPDYAEPAQPAAPPRQPPAEPAAPVSEAPGAAVAEPEGPEPAVQAEAPEPAAQAEAPEPAAQAEAEGPEPAEPEPVESGATESEAVVSVKGVSRRAALRKERIRTRRQVLGGIAEALARAEDPTLSGLPGAEEAAQALAELRQMTPPEPARQPEPAPQPEPEAAPPEVEDTVEPAVTEPAIAEPAVAEEPAPEPVREEPGAEEIVPPAPVEAVSATVLVDAEETSELEAEPGPTIAEEPEPVRPEVPTAEAAPEPMPEEFVETDAVQDEVAAPEPMPEEAFVAEPTLEEVPAEAEPAAAPLEAEPAAAEASPYTTDVVEPDWFADGDFTWLEVGEQPRPEPEPGGEPTRPTDPRNAAAPPESAPSPPGTEQRREDWWPSEEQGRQQPRPDVGMDLPRTEAHASEDVRPSAVATATSDEEELMWLGDEFEQAELEIATPGWRGQATPVAQPEASAPPAAAVTRESAGQAPGPLELSDDDLARLAQEEGWDTSEVEAIRTFLGRSTDAAQDAAEQPSGTAPEQEPQPIEPAEPTAGPPSYAALEVGAQESGAPESGAPEGAAGAAPASDPPAPQAPAGGPAQQDDEPRPLKPGDPAWLRGRRGPAAAYRRLRRLFPDGG